MVRGSLPERQHRGTRCGLKPLFTKIDQKEHEGIDGYNTGTWGMVGGWETERNNRTLWGVALAYAKSDVDGDGAGNSQLEVNHYHASVYGSLNRAAYQIQWQTGYARNQYRSERTLSFSGLQAVARGEFGTHQFSAGGNSA